MPARSVAGRSGQEESITLVLGSRLLRHSNAREGSADAALLRRAASEPLGLKDGGVKEEVVWMAKAQGLVAEEATE